MIERLGQKLRAYAEKDGRGYPDWALRYVPVVRRMKTVLPAHARVLEIGANENGYARFAKTPVIAVDVSLEHLRAARAVQDVRAVAADLAALPFRADAFDGCVCMDTFEHVDEAKRIAAIKEIARVIKPSGIAVLGFPCGEAAARAETEIREDYRAFTGGALRWLEEHRTAGLPDVAVLTHAMEAAVHDTHRIRIQKNTNIAVWVWMWRVLMCGWPGRGNDLFQALLRFMTPLLCWMHFGTCYRALVWLEPRNNPPLDPLPWKGRGVNLPISIVIPTWNQRALLVKCLESIQRQTYQDCDVIVVDDGGTDDTGEVVARDFPHVCVIRREVNGGFAKAVNEGIAAASGDWVFLLNNDMVLEPDCLEKLAHAANDTRVVYGPLVLMADDTARIYSAGDRVGINARPESIGFRQALEGFDFSEAPFGITAGAALYPRNLFDTVGTFDERFIAYFEDVDLNFRARLAGYSCALVREAVVYHHGAASIQERLWWRTRQCLRNHALLLIKNFPASVIVRHFPAIAAERLRYVARTFSAVRCKRGAWGAVCELARVAREVVSILPELLNERRRIHRGRVITPDDFDKLLYRGRAAHE